ncbi:MAG: hypothetical protein ACN4GT_08655 [Gammaproteobacteria bacterium]
MRAKNNRGRTRAKSNFSAAATRLLLVFCIVLPAGCATRMYAPADVASATFMDREMTQEAAAVRVTVAVPDAGETEALFGLPLYDQGVQPVWIEVENTGSDLLRLLVWSVDPDYYSPLEVAWMNRGGYSKEGKAAMERWFYEHSVERRIPPGETRAGFVYTHFKPGTKGFNVDVISAALESHSFTFFVPMPGFTADYMAVDFQGMYADDELVALDDDGLRDALEGLACCATDASGTLEGTPFNVALIGTGTAVRRALLRANWQEIELGAADTEGARLQHYRGRPPDGTFFKKRVDGSERKELRLWLTPLRVGADRVWLGQTGTVVGDARRKATRTLTAPDIDAPTIYLIQEFWYSQSLQRVGYVRAQEAVPASAPRTTFNGLKYFTSGLRGVLWLSEDPIGLDEVSNMNWEEAPVD